MVGGNAVPAPIPVIAIRAPRGKQLDVARGAPIVRLQAHEEVTRDEHTPQRQPERLPQGQVEGAEAQAASLPAGQQRRQLRCRQGRRAARWQRAEAPLAEDHPMPAAEPGAVVRCSQARITELCQQARQGAGRRGSRAAGARLRARPRRFTEPPPCRCEGSQARASRARAAARLIDPRDDHHHAKQPKMGTKGALPHARTSLSPERRPACGQRSGQGGSLQARPPPLGLLQAGWAHLAPADGS